MFPLLTNLTLRHDFDHYGQNLNYVFSNGFQNLRNPLSLYSTSTVENYIEETNTDINELITNSATLKEEVDLICDNKEFSKLLISYLNSILKNNSKENIEFFKENYVLDLELKTLSRSRFSKDFKDLSVSNFKSQFQNTNVTGYNLNIDDRNFPFVFLLSDWILDRKYHNQVIKYVKFFCWNLLFGEFEVFIRDACIDYYSRGNILPAHGDSLLTDNILRHNLRFTDDVDSYINHFKSVLDLENAKGLIHKYFRSTRDSFYVESYDEPLELIYAGEYEQLLLRDLEGPFKIVYATDELWDMHVTTLLSYIYSSFRKQDFKNLEKFKLKDQ